MNILDELESIACAVGGESDTFKRVSGIVDRLMASLKAAERERDEARAAQVPAMPMQDDTCGCSDCEEGFPCATSKAMPIPKREPVAEVEHDGSGLVFIWPIGDHQPDGTKLYAHPQPAQAAAIPEWLCIDENLKRLALDYVRCGIGANYSRESFEDRMMEIYYPFRKIIDLIPLSASPKPE